MQSVAQTPPPVTTFDLTSNSAAPPLPASRGAYFFTSIMRSYLCRTGPRAGSTKFTDTEKLERINFHLASTGKLPISRRTFYRWKRAARNAGLLSFASTAKHAAVRKRVTGGRWMSVVSVPAVSVGRFPRILPLPPAAPRGTFGSSPPRGTFGSSKTLRDNSPHRGKKSSSSPAKKFATRTPDDRKGSLEETERRAKSKRAAGIEEKLAEIGQKISSDASQPWRPDPHKQSWRVGAIKKALDAGATPASLELAVVGQAARRAHALFSAQSVGVLHDYWERDGGDIVATASSYFYRRNSGDGEGVVCGERVGENERLAIRTARNYGVDLDAANLESFAGFRLGGTA